MDDEDSLCIKKGEFVIDTSNPKVRCLQTGCFFALGENYKEEAFWIT